MAKGGRGAIYLTILRFWGNFVSSRFSNKVAPKPQNSLIAPLPANVQHFLLKSKIQMKYTSLSAFYAFYIKTDLCQFNKLIFSLECLLFLSDNKKLMQTFEQNENIDNVSSDSGYCDPKLVWTFYCSLKIRAIIYSCNNITTTWISISRQNWNDFFSNGTTQIHDRTTFNRF